MKGYVTFFLTAVMALGLLFLLVTRARTPHDAPAADPVVAFDAGDGGSAEAGVATSMTPLAATEAGTESGAPKPAEPPLRIVTLGWELAAAGAALTAPDGGPTSVPMELAPESTLDAVEARLARGGADPVGADIAVLPLPAFVLAYDRLRALDPRAFLVVGFSRGREEVRAASGALLKSPPAGDEVKLVALGPGTTTDPTARIAGSESATMLGLFALDLLGVAPVRVRAVASGAASEKDAAFAAVVRGASDPRKLALSSADASRFVPLVAVAPKAFLDAREGRVRDFARAWLDGLERAGKDASNVTRRLANKEALPLAAGVGGPPEAIALLDRLGQIAPAGLVEQRRLMGSSEPVTLETLLQRQWMLARGGGLTTTSAPVPLPIDDRIVRAIAPAPAPTPPAALDAAGAFAPLPAGSTPLVAYRADPAADVASVVSQIGFLSGVFERAAFRVSAKGGDKAARAIAMAAREKFALPASRIAIVAAEPAGAFAVVEVVALP